MFAHRNHFHQFYTGVRDMSEDMQITEHAKKRMQQRGIPKNIIDWLLRFGDSTRGYKCKVLQFSKKGQKRMKIELGNQYAQLEKTIRSAYIIVQGNTIITAGHRYKRIKVY